MTTIVFDRLYSGSNPLLDRLVGVTVGGLVITSVSAVQDGQPITINGTGFSASGNRVLLGLPGQEIGIPINTESTTQIVTQAIDAQFFYLTRQNGLFVQKATSEVTQTVPVTILPQTGQIAAAITQGFLGDVTTRGSSTPADLVQGDEIRIKNVVGGTTANVSMTGQGAFVVASGVTAFDYAIQDGSGLGGFQTVNWSDPPTLVAVPDISLLTKSQAISAVAAAGFISTLFPPQASATVPLGLVLGQFPFATTLLVLGGDVEITLSLGLTGTIVPILTAISIAQADAVRQAAGLIGSDFRLIDGNNSGLVLNQSVNPGEILNTGSPVDLVYSTNLAPNELGKPVQTAVADLLAANLVVAPLLFAFSAQPVGTILVQSPPGDSVVNPGDTITLTESLGPLTAEGGGVSRGIGVSGPGVSSGSGVSGAGVSFVTPGNNLVTESGLQILTEASANIITEG